jgi:hypothetical protein
VVGVCTGPNLRKRKNPETGFLLISLFSVSSSLASIARDNAALAGEIGKAKAIHKL